MNSERTEPIVVFADILGFADLVLDLEPRIGVIDYAYRSAMVVQPPSRVTESPQLKSKLFSKVTARRTSRSSP